MHDLRGGKAAQDGRRMEQIPVLRQTALGTLHLAEETHDVRFFFVNLLFAFHIITIHIFLERNLIHNFKFFLFFKK